MPKPRTLQQMYGLSYESAFSKSRNRNIEDPKEPKKCLEWLRNGGTGTFLDYGCGAGELLGEAAKAGWRPIREELDSHVAGRIQERTGFRVLRSGVTATSTPECGDSVEGWLAEKPTVLSGLHPYPNTTFAHARI